MEQIAFDDISAIEKHISEDFGAFGNNYVDHRTEKRYREFYSFPGVDLNQIPAKNFVKGMLEWNLPPLRSRLSILSSMPPEVKWP